MIYRVEIRTDDPKLIEVLTEVRNKAKFVKKALKHYICTKRGKETFMIMSKREPKEIESEKSKKPETSISPPSSGNKKKGVYDFDRFLWTK